MRRGDLTIPYLICKLPMIQDVSNLTQISCGYQVVESFMKKLHGLLSIETQNGTAVMMNIKYY